MPRRPKPHEEIWTFLTNHTHVLVCIHRDEEMTMREISDEIGITERAVQRIVKDLVAAGYLIALKDGRRNRYHLNFEKNLRHRLEGNCQIGELLELVKDKASP